LKHTLIKSPMTILLSPRNSRLGEENPSLKLPDLTWARFQIVDTSRSRSS